MNSLRMESERVLYPKLKVAVSENGTVTLRHAYRKDARISFRILVPRQVGTTALTLVLHHDESGKRSLYPCRWEAMEGASDVWAGELPPLPVGLYYLGFSLMTAVGCAACRRTDQDGVYWLYRSESDEAAETPFQLLFSDFRYPAPEWLLGGIIYHVFVDRFYKGEHTLPQKKGTVMNEDWENGIPQFPAYPGAPLANNMFFGGNLYGIAEKLDYLKSLSVTCLYLSPIFDAASNHKYDTGDYLTVDEMFGGVEALRYLIKEADARGIRIFFDGVFNHTGADSLYFNRYGNYPSVGAYQSKESPYYSWYDFKDYPNRYTAWWDIEILPRISPDKPLCRQFFTGENGVIRTWMKEGIAGFRLDVADELSDDFIADIKRTMQEYREDSILYGEVWEDASQKIAYDVRRRYYQGAELDGVMNYPLRTGLIKFFRSRSTDALRYALTDIIYNAPKRIRDMQMNLLGTHDTERILTSLAGDPRGESTNAELSVKRMSKSARKKGIRLLSLAYLTLATLPGVPAIFYGDEVGMEGYGDPFNRLPFPWHNMDEVLLNTYRTIGEFRTAHSVYKNGEFSLLALDTRMLAFARTEKGRAYVTCINRAPDAVLTVTGEAPLSLAFGSAEKKGSRVFTLAPLSGCVFTLSDQAQLDFSYN